MGKNGAMVPKPSVTFEPNVVQVLYSCQKRDFFKQNGCTHFEGSIAKRKLVIKFVVSRRIGTFSKSNFFLFCHFQNFLHFKFSSLLIRYVKKCFKIAIQASKIVVLHY